MTMDIFDVTWDTLSALGRFFIRIIIGIVRFVTGVTEEAAAVIASARSVLAQRVHDGASHNGCVHNIGCDIGGFAPNRTLVSI